MKPTTPKHPDDIFTGKADNPLSYVFTKAQLLQALNTKCIALLDASLRSACQVANISGSKLTFLVTNGSVATQIRFMVPDLLRQFKLDPQLQSIKDIHCLVRPQTARSKPVTRKALPPLSPENAAMIDAIADGMEQGPLQKALKKIASYTKR